MAMKFEVVNKIFYVRGMVCENLPTVIMVAATTHTHAASKAADFAVTGEITVIPQDEWDATGGLEEGENFIIGFVT